MILEETASLDMLFWQLLDETMELKLRSEVAKELALFKELTKAEQGHEVARLMAIIAKNNTAAVIIDQDALLDDYGRYSDDFACILEALKENEDTYVVIIHNRRPDLSVIVNRSPGIAFHRLNPLSLEDTELLLQQTFRMDDVEAMNPQIKSLALHMDGYPPTIELASAYAKFYGIETLMADKSILADFEVRTFAPLLSRVGLDEQEWEILRMLAGEPSLPLEVLAEILSVSPEECARALRHLIDINLVLPVEYNFAISPPVRRAVSTTRGPLSKSEYAVIAGKLLAAFWTDPDAIPPLGIVDATIHALARSNVKKLEDFRNLILPSQLYKVAQEEYNAQNWDAAIEFAKRTLTADHSRDGARIILFKAWVRKERWSEAEMVLKELEKRGVRAQFYCRGFLEWKRGNLGAAVSAFRSALDAGDRSVSVFRDLAFCLFRLAKVSDAKNILSKAPEWIFHNSYVVDLAVQIAIAERDWASAEGYLSSLEHIAAKEDFYYRRATLRDARNEWMEALEDVEIACSRQPPRFEAMAQRANVLIELGRFPEANSAVENLIALGVMKRDVKTGLKCKLLLRQLKWQEAEVVWQGLHQKELPVHKGLRRDILLQKATDMTIGLVDRNEAVAELERIGEPVQLPLVSTEEDRE